SGLHRPSGLPRRRRHAAAERVRPGGFSGAGSRAYRGGVRRRARGVLVTGRIDPAAIVAFDVHTHVHRSVHRPASHIRGGAEDMGEYFGIGEMPTYTVPELADYYRQRKLACVVFTVDSVSRSGEEPEPDNVEIA